MMRPERAPGEKSMRRLKKGRLYYRLDEVWWSLRPRAFIRYNFGKASAL